MFLANSWGLLGLLTLPVIVAIHLYHRRYPPLLVAGLHLWGLESHTAAAGRTREQLPITKSLICELLVALLLSLVLADPRWGHLGRVEHLVVVLDNSASMSAKPPGSAERSFREAAVSELERRVERLPRGSVLTLLRTGRRPEMLAGPAVPWEEAKLKLSDWRPALAKHDFHPTWDLASQLAADTGRLLFLTDRVPDGTTTVPATMEVVSFGRALENVAISAARWDFDSQSAQGKVFVRLTNYGQRAATVRVVGRVGSAEQRDTKPQSTSHASELAAHSNTAKALFQNEVTLDPGQSKPLEVNVPGGLGRIVIDLESIGDGLALDNRVELIEPKLRMLQVQVTLPVESVAGRAIRRVLTNIPDVTLTDSDPNLVIAPAHPLPPSKRDSWWLGIGPIDPAETARKAAADLAGPFVLEKQNPLLDGITLAGIVWGGVQAVSADITPIITAGSSPLLSRLNGTRATAHLLNIDLARSNLIDAPDWPILLSNLIELRRDNLPGLRRWNYRLNEDIRFRLFDELPAEPLPVVAPNTDISTTTTSTDTAPKEGTATPTVESRPLWLVHRGDKRPLAQATVIELPPLDEAGVYSVLDGDRPVGEFAVNFFDHEESTLTSLRPGIRAPEEFPRLAGFTIDQPLTWLILVGIVLITLTAFADWHVLRPRVRSKHHH